jgi:hypothetical protein
VSSWCHWDRGSSAPEFARFAIGRQRAAEYGLHVTFSTIPGTSGQIVFSQSPGVGTQVEYGDTIQLFMV